VTAPTQLKLDIGGMGNTGKVDAILANFGHIKYGTMFHAQLFSPKINWDACQEFHPNHFETDQDPMKEKHAEKKANLPVLLVRHGGCSHAKKGKFA